MAFIPYTGYGSNVYWEKEASYGSAPATVNNRFGVGQEINSLSLGRNYERVWTLGDRRFNQHIYTRFEPSISVGFRLADPRVFNLVLEGTYDTGTNRTVFGVGDLPVSATVDAYLGRYPGDTSTSRVRITGAVARRLGLSVRSGGMMQVSLEMAGKDVAVGTATPPSVPDYTDLVTFSSITLGGDFGTAKVTNLSLNVNNNPELVYVLGDDRPSFPVVKRFEVSGSMDIVADNLGELADLISNTPITLSLTMARVGSSGGVVTGGEIGITLGGIVKVEEFELSVSPNEPVEKRISFVASDITVSVEGGDYTL